jgi:signal transduction histidine kinase
VRLRSWLLSNTKGEWPFHSASKAREAVRTEKILATARAAVVGFLLVAIYFDPTRPARYAVHAYALLLAYACLSFAFFLWLRRKPIESRIAPIVHAIDFSFVVLISIFTQGSDSAVYVFFTFVVLASAYRWGFLETVATGGAFLIVLLTERISTAGIGSVDLNRFVMRSTYLSLVTLLLGYLAEEEKRVRQENSLIARLLRMCQIEGELNPIIQTSLKMIGEFYGAKRVLILIQEKSSQRIFRWQYLESDEETPSRLDEVNPDDGQKYLFSAPVPVWCWRNLRSQPNYRAAGVDSEGVFVPQVRFQPPELFPEAASCESMLASTFVFGDDLAGRLYVLDPRLPRLASREMLYLSRLSEKLGPVVLNIYLWRRLRSRARVIEQARAAREMHDGIIQSLIGLELEIEALLLKNELDPLSRRELERVQNLLRAEGQDLRDLMHRMKMPALTPRELIVFLTELVTKFGYETGIKARFVSEAEAPPPNLSLKACHEVARIVQEALVNVRKHSHASRVDVTLASDAGGLVLMIEDDGTATRVAGRLSEADITQNNWQPVVIRERVHLLKGSLKVESRPGPGARLVIRIPTSETPQRWAAGGRNSSWPA